METNVVKICVPVAVAHVAELDMAIRRAVEVGDIIELRLDSLNSSELATHGISAILKSCKRPIILTLRSAESGGARVITAEERLSYRFRASLINSNSAADFWDLELDLALRLQQRENEGQDLLQLGVCDWSRTICSYHDFVGGTSDLDQIYQTMAATPGRIIKIAVRAGDATDCLAIFRLLERAKRERRELIAIGMGQAGVMTRILGPSRGSYLTYGSLDDESATAPGQLTARELRWVYRIHRIDQQTEITGLIGQPVAHSISPHIHNAALAQADANAVFIPFEVNDVEAFMRRMVRPSSREIDWNLRGFSVTAPHKTAVMKHLDWIEPSAQEIGAVNTIVLSEGDLNGYNTDAAAFIKQLISRFKSLENVRCAIIGSGGAARGVVWALRQAGASISLFARRFAQANTFANELQIDAYDLSTAKFDGFDIVVNATPLGTRGRSEQETPATREQLRGVRLAYDLVYNPVETRFLREARAAGCKTVGGLEMLIGQAVAQFKLWTGKQPDKKVMRSAAKSALYNLAGNQN